MTEKKILVIDDDPIMLDILKTFLRSQGFGVETALDGVEGLSRVENYRPNLILLDVMMPKMDGYTFIRELRKNEKFRDMPVVVLTGREMMREMFMQEGVLDYVMKPFQAEELLAIISKYLN